MKYTKDNIKNGIIEKVNSMNVTEGEKEWLRMRLIQYPKEIEQNVLEWINDLPLTDIDCHGESILKTMAAWNINKDDIPYVINGFVSFAKRNFRVSDVIWQSVKGMDGVYD